MNSVVQNVKNYISTKLTITEETREKIRETIKKIVEFINNNKSLVIFGLTVLFSYYMAPVSAFKYFGKSFKTVLIDGILFGSTVLILQNIFASRSITENRDDKINYLASIVNVGQTYLNPTYGFINAVFIVGFIAIKSVVNYLFPPTSDEGKLYALVDVTKKQMEEISKKEVKDADKKKE